MLLLSHALEKRGYSKQVQITKSLFIFFLLVQFFTRLTLTIIEYKNINEDLWLVLRSFLYGFTCDIAAFSFFLIPIGLFLFLPHKKILSSKVYNAAILFLFTFFIYFIAVAEYLFWCEFHNRFNFIVVDYLVYTHEVLNNIKESYPLYIIWPAVLILPLITMFFLLKGLFSNLRINIMTLLFAAISFYFIYNASLNRNSNQYADENAKNGYFALFSAFLQNEISYQEFYLQQDQAISIRDLRSEIQTSNSEFLNDGILRKIKGNGDKHRYNIMLIVVESLSAKFLSAFGNQKNFTPYLNELANESILFKNLYAAGIRTSYGLSAINLSIPPIPGNAIIRKPHNENLISLGYILQNKGYDSKFIYAGDSYFDNMNYFFSNNGYEVIDGNSFAKDEVTFANAWGACDEDLFNKVIKESDKSYNSGKPFFNMIMTISNHKPFTYPDHKIDIKSGSGRGGAIKYTDYAIKQFITKAKTKAWFDNTVFIILADHSADSTGKIELDRFKYHIPMIIYAPKITPTLCTSPKLTCLDNSYSSGYVDQLMSQIDVAPTILGLLNMSYKSTFYGKNALKDNINRSFASNYQKLGYFTDQSMVVLKPTKLYSYYEFDENHNTTPKQMANNKLLEIAISYFQIASEWQKFNDRSFGLRYSNPLR